MWSQATQYDETHEWFERCGVHGRPSQRARFGSMINAAARRSCPTSSGAPIAKSRRGPGEAPPSVAFDDGSRRSRRSTTPATPAPTPVAAIIDPVRPAVAVSATIAASVVSVAHVNTSNQRGTGDIKASWTSDERGGFARQGAFYLAGRACRRVPAYSQRNATIGSARIARRAGTQHANSTAAPRSGITPTNVNGSVGLV